MRFNNFSFIYLFIFTLSSCTSTDLLMNKEDSTSNHIKASSDHIDDVGFQKIPPPQPEKITIPPIASTAFDKAKGLMREKKWQEAIKDLNLMADAYPNLSGVQTNLGIAYEKVSLFEKAEDAYLHAVKINPLNFDAYQNIGVLMRQLGRFEEAKMFYTDALSLWPHNRAILINLAILQDLYLSEQSQALKHYELAKKLDEREDKQLKGWIIDLKRRIE